MTDFVDECRREWRRLRVPDAVAGEMAAELEADLEEAASDGVSAEALLGSDPRSFAAAWAAERGLIGRPRPIGRRLAWVPLAIAACAMIAVTGAVLIVLDSSSEPTLETFAVPSLATPAETGTRPVLVAAEGDVRTILAPEVRIELTGSNDSGVQTDTVGSVLVFVALAGIVSLALFWFYAGYAGRRKEFA
jgi:hypothetical protein